VPLIFFNLIGFERDEYLEVACEMSCLKHLNDVMYACDYTMFTGLSSVSNITC